MCSRCLPAHSWGCGLLQQPKQDRPREFRRQSLDLCLPDSSCPLMRAVLRKTGLFIRPQVSLVSQAVGFPQIFLGEQHIMYSEGGYIIVLFIYLFFIFSFNKAVINCRSYSSKDIHTSWQTNPPCNLLVIWFNIFLW